MTGSEIQTTIYLNDREYGMRLWEQVPRVGDYINLRESIEDQEQFFVGKVKQVIWFERKDFRPEVKLYCTR